MTTPAAPHDGLTLLLAPRQADLMRLFWAHGQGTVRDVQQWLKESDLAYSTIATLCGRLVEKGLLSQQRLEPSDRSTRGPLSYTYTPRISEADFVRAAIMQQLGGLLGHYPDLVCSYVAEHATRDGADEGTGDRANVEHILANLAPPRGAPAIGAGDAVVDSVAALRERAEAAERQAASWEAEARRAQHQAKLATARYKRAKARAREWEATARRATAQALAAEEQADAVIRRVALQQHAAARSAPEYYDPAGVCRVCNAPASEVSARRRDGLRVCEAESCRQEARRRDHAAKQRQQRARWRQRREHAGTLAT